MDSPGNRGYWGGQFDPREKDLIKEMWLPKSLQALVEIKSRDWAGETEKVWVISQREKIVTKIKNTSTRVLLFRVILLSSIII
jgi:hypothetical protein